MEKKRVIISSWPGLNWSPPKGATEALIPPVPMAIITRAMMSSQGWTEAPFPKKDAAAKTTEPDMWRQDSQRMVWYFPRKPSARMAPKMGRMRAAVPKPVVVTTALTGSQPQTLMT